MTGNRHRLCSNGATVCTRGERRDEEDQTFQTYRADLASLRSFLTAFDAAVTALVTTPAGASAAPIVGAALREQIKVAKPEISHLLFVDVTASGGDAVSKANLWGWNATAAFLGAVQATYLLVTVDGQLVASGAPTAFGAATFNFQRAFPKDVIGWDVVNELLRE